MNLEEIIDKYEKNPFFRLKANYDYYKKKALYIIEPSIAFSFIPLLSAYSDRINAEKVMGELSFDSLMLHEKFAFFSLTMFSPFFIYAISKCLRIKEKFCTKASFFGSLAFNQWYSHKIGLPLKDSLPPQLMTSYLTPYMFKNIFTNVLKNDSLLSKAKVIQSAFYLMTDKEKSNKIYDEVVKDKLDNYSSLNTLSDSESNNALFDTLNHFLEKGEMEHILFSFKPISLFRKGTKSRIVEDVYYYMMNGRYNKSIKEIDKLEGLDANILKAYYFQKLTEILEERGGYVKGIVDLCRKYNVKEEIENRWDKAITTLFNSDCGYKQLVEGRIMMFDYSPLLRRTLVLKKGTKEEHEEEMAIMNQKIDSDEFYILKPIKIVEHNDEHYLVNLYCEGPLFNEVSEIENYKNLARFIKLKHKNLKSNNGDRDYKLIVEERMKELDYDREEWNQLWNNIPERKVLDLDPHGAQYILGERLTRVDLNDKGNVQLGFQLNKTVVESGLKGENEHIILDTYCADSEEYWRCMIPSALSYLCYPTFKGIDINEVKKRYIRNARKACQMFGYDALDDCIAENFI